MVLPFLCVGSFGAVPESMPCRLGPRGRVSGQWNNSLSGRCLAGFQVGARGQVSPPVVLLTVSLREMWEVCSVSRGEYREAGSSDGGCVLGLLSSGHNSVPPGEPVLAPGCVSLVFLCLLLTWRRTCRTEALCVSATQKDLCLLVCKCGKHFFHH